MFGFRVSLLERSRISGIVAIDKLRYFQKRQAVHLRASAGMIEKLLECHKPIAPPSCFRGSSLSGSVA